MRSEMGMYRKKNLRRDVRGFSLIELLIVVAIILIIAAIAIPNFLRSRMAANQASAIQSMRVVNTAEITYSSTFQVGFSSTLLQLGPPPSGIAPTTAAADLVDSLLAAGNRGGYTFIYTPRLPDATGNYIGYVLNANPTSPGTTGTAYYYTDESHVIRASTTGVATSSDSPVAQ
jgi:type IV pilus assembly protein PilA